MKDLDSCLFGEIINGEMKLNTNGEIATGAWLSIIRHFANVKLDEGEVTSIVFIESEGGDFSEYKSFDLVNELSLNTGQFLKTVGDNVKLINSYNFRNGVEGFTNMVARSQALRINMADVTSLAGKLLDPSEAINLAAEFQMLGGAVGALADPFQLMNMASTRQAQQFLRKRTFKKDLHKISFQSTFKAP